MKKIIAVLLVFALSLGLMACGSQKTTVLTEGDNADEINTESAGGWTIEEAKEIELPAEAKAAFEKALDGYTGAGLTPIGYLGSQVVAGTNYKILCRETLVTADLITKISVVTVYADLEDNAEILDVTEVDLISFLGNTNEFTNETLLGGWMVDDAFGAGLEGDCKNAFEAATADYTGVGFEPIALLGIQVVAGVNYTVLCKAVTMTAEPQTGLCVVTIYAGVDGTNQITSVDAFEY